MNALEFYRLRNDLTQEELGKQIGVSKQTIYKLEKQIAPVSSKHYQTLKDILNLSESEMVNVISSGEMMTHTLLFIEQLHDLPQFAGCCAGSEAANCRARLHRQRKGVFPELCRDVFLVPVFVPGYLGNS